jgi:hypothetical protein
MRRRAVAPPILLVVILILMLFATPGCATDVPKATIEVEWEKPYVETDYNNQSSSRIQQTSDGGYLIITRTDCSYRANVGPPAQIADCACQLTKTDGYGDVEWVQHRTCEWHPLLSVEQTPDGGYMLVSSDRVGKIDSTGVEEWEKSLGYELNYWAPFHQTPDGGHILVSADRVVKIDSTGAEQWQKALDYKLTGPTPFQQTSDGGYVAVSGRTLRKFDAARNEVWQRTFDSFDIAFDTVLAVQTSDGGYILAGAADCHGQASGGITTIDFCDFQLIKTDCGGDVEWDTRWPTESGYFSRCSLKTTSEGGYLLTALDPPTRPRLMKADASGRQEWDKTFATTEHRYTYSVQQTSDGGYAISGKTARSDDEYWIPVQEDTSTFCLMKMDGNGDIMWDAELICPGRIEAVAQTSDSEYVTVGHRYDPAAQRVDIWLMKVKCTPP